MRVGDPRRQGRNGEWAFGERCTALSEVYEAVVNKATDDQHGWDHIVEISPRTVNTLPADLDQQVIQSFAQIKTSTKRKSVRLKLSNAIKSAQSPLPSFVFLMLSTNDGVALYGRHIWREEIYGWLKSARELELYPSRSITRSTVTLRYSNDDLITIHPIEWMMKKIGERSSHKYSVEKSNIITSVGYEQSGVEGLITFSGISSNQDIVQHELGLTDKLRVSEFIVHDKRFGIRSRDPIDIIREGTFSIGTGWRPVTLRLTSVNNNFFDCPAEVVASSIFRPPSPDFRARLRCGAIDVVFGHSRIGEPVHFELDFACARASLTQNIGTILLINWSSLGPIKLHINFDLGTLWTGTVNINHKPDSIYFNELDISIKFAIEVIGRECMTKVATNFIETRNFLKSLIGISALYFEKEFFLEPIVNKPIENRVTFIGYFILQLNDWCFSCLCKSKSLSKKSDEQPGIRFEPLQIIESSFFQESCDSAKNRASRKLESYKNENTADYLSYEDGDLSDLLGNIDHDQ